MKTGTTIGTLAKKTGFSVAAIRFYEQKELSACVDRTSNGGRSFGQTEFASLNFNARCRDAGMSLDSIQQLLSLSRWHNHAL